MTPTRPPSCGSTGPINTAQVSAGGYGIVVRLWNPKAKEIEAWEFYQGPARRLGLLKTFERPRVAAVTRRAAGGGRLGEVGS